MSAVFILSLCLPVRNGRLLALILTLMKSRPPLHFDEFASAYSRA